MALKTITVEDQCPEVADILAGEISKYINLHTNKCGYSGTVEELIFNYFHPLFLNFNATEIKEDNPNWREANTGPFVDKYWKAMKTKILTL